jgi:hypothetical protein
MSLLARMGLLDYETTEDAPAPEPPSPAPPEPAPEPAPEPGEPEPAEPESWAGPSREEWEQTQAALAEYQQFMAQLQQPMYPEPEPQAQELPPYDPYDPEAAQAHMDARDARLLQAMQQMISPVTEQYQNEQATSWADQTFTRLGVPEEEHWRDGVLFASAGFQQFDQYGRPLVHPQQAAAQGYEFLQRFAEAERAAERERIKQQGAQQDEALKARAAAPSPVTGPAGGEGIPEGLDELQVARMWRERQIAQGG